MSGLSKITQKLMEQGYTMVQYPVPVKRSNDYGGTELFKLNGGFEYQP